MPGPFNPDPWPWEKPPPPPPPPKDDSARLAALQQYIDKYGPQIGQAAAVTSTVHVPPDAKLADGSDNPNAGKTITADSGFKTYTFPNGVSVEISDDGEVRNEKLPASATRTQSQTAPTTTTRLVYNSDGSTDEWSYRYDPNAIGPNGDKGGYVLDKSLPPVHKPPDPTKAAPSDPSKWQKVYADPGDPTSRVVALQDPKTGDRVTVPEGAQPQKPSIVTGADGATYSWDGSSLSKLIDAKPDKPQLVQGAGGVMYSWDGKSLQQLGGAKEGQTRTSLDPKNPNRTITETFSGGSWVPTNIQGGDKPGDTRQSIEGGYNVTQTYGNDGTWRTTSVGSRATPQQPTQVNAPATSQFITTMDQDGKVGTVPNPNYQPTTMAQIAGQQVALQQQAQSQHDQINSNLQNGVYGSGPDAQDKANAAWQQWWAQNIEPQKAALAQAQQQAAFDQQKQQQDLARANYQQAQTAGQNAVANYAATLPMRVGPGYGQAVNQIVNAFATGKPVQNLDVANAVTFKMPDLQQMAQQATAQALAHISPAAAQIATGNPMPSMFANPPDINSQLNQTSYSPFGASLPAGPPAMLPGPAPTDTTGQAFSSQQIPGLDLSQMPGFAGAQSTFLGQTTPGLNLSAMPGYAGAQSVPLPTLAPLPYVYSS
jgi:hypothetical protein